MFLKIRFLYKNLISDTSFFVYLSEKHMMFAYSHYFIVIDSLGWGVLDFSMV